MKLLLSWFKKGEKFDTYACSSDTPEAIARMRADGFISMDEQIDQIIKEAKEAKERN